MNMIDYYKKAVFENYANFNGRASRSEYWYFTLMQLIIAVTAAVMDNLLGINFAPIPYGPIYAIVGAAILLPSLAVGVRRLHDIGKSGWFFLINLIPLVGPIWFLVVLCSKSEDGSNQYGPNPFDTESELDLLGTE